MEKKQSVRNYIHSGGFNRLAGRPLAPGSWRPEESFWKWRTALTVTGLLFLITGLFFVVF